MPLEVESPATEPAGRQRSRSAAGGAVPHDTGNDPFDPIAPAREGKERARGSRRESDVARVSEFTREVAMFLYWS